MSSLVRFNKCLDARGFPHQVTEQPAMPAMPAIDATQADLTCGRCGRPATHIAAAMYGEMALCGGCTLYRASDYMTFIMTLEQARHVDARKPRVVMTVPREMLFKLAIESVPQLSTDVKTEVLAAMDAHASVPPLVLHVRVDSCHSCAACDVHTETNVLTLAEMAAAINASWNLSAEQVSRFCDKAQEQWALGHYIPVCWSNETGAIMEVSGMTTAAARSVLSEEHKVWRTLVSAWPQQSLQEVMRGDVVSNEDAPVIAADRVSRTTMRAGGTISTNINTTEREYGAMREGHGWTRGAVPMQGGMVWMYRAL